MANHATPPPPKYIYPTITGQRARRTSAREPVPKPFEGPPPKVFYCWACGTNSTPACHAIAKRVSSFTKRSWVVKFASGGIGLAVGDTAKCGKELIVFAVLGPTDLSGDKTSKTAEVSNIRLMVSPWRCRRDGTLKIAVKESEILISCRNISQWHKASWAKTSFLRGLGKFKNQDHFNNTMLRRFRERQRHASRDMWDNAWRRYAKNGQKDNFRIAVVVNPVRSTVAHHEATARTFRTPRASRQRSLNTTGVSRSARPAPHAATTTPSNAQNVDTDERAQSRHSQASDGRSASPSESSVVSEFEASTPKLTLSSEASDRETRSSLRTASPLQAELTNRGTEEQPIPTTESARPQQPRAQSRAGSAGRHRQRSTSQKRKRSERASESKQRMEASTNGSHKCKEARHSLKETSLYQEKMTWTETGEQMTI